MDSKDPSQRGSTTQTVVIAATVLITACWSAATLARTQGDTDCDEMARALQEPGTPVESLAIRNVDHVPIEADFVELDSIDLETPAEETATPLLDLTPRVTNALRDIFNEDRATIILETALEFPAEPGSPVAETDDIPLLSELPEGVEPALHQVEEESDLPLLQRQMYRIDI